MLLAISDAGVSFAQKTAEKALDLVPLVKDYGWEIFAGLGVLIALRGIYEATQFGRNIKDLSDETENKESKG